MPDSKTTSQPSPNPSPDRGWTSASLVLSASPEPVPPTNSHVSPSILRLASSSPVRPTSSSARGAASLADGETSRTPDPSTQLMRIQSRDARDGDSREGSQSPFRRPVRSQSLVSLGDNTMPRVSSTRWAAMSKFSHLSGVGDGVLLRRGSQRSIMDIEGRSASSSTGGSGPSVPAAEAVCQFSGGPGRVWLFTGPVKRAARMREKLEEYAKEGAAWPLCAQV